MLTFTLVVTLLYPGGELKLYALGHDLSHAQCEAAKVRALTQLPATLSLAEVFAADCVEEREA
jgi:hypothetical protein